MIFDRLIVMFDVSDLADKSDEFANFLTVSRKYGLTCVYIFHTIYPSRQNWQMIMSQTQIFNFFPGSVHSSTITRILSSFANRYKNTYIPTRNVWINSILKYRTQGKNNAWQLTLGTLTILVLESSGHKLTMGRDKFAIIIETKPTLVLILFWQQENKHLKKVR